MSSAKLGNFNQCVAKTTCMDHVLFWLVGNHTCNTRFTFIQKSFLALLGDLRAATWRCPKSCRYRQKIVVLNPWSCFFFWCHLVQWAEMATILARCYECGRSSFGRNRQVTPKTPAKHSPCCKVFLKICNHQDSSFSGAIHTSSLFIQILHISFTTMILL